MTAAKSETIWQTKSDIVVAIDTLDKDFEGLPVAFSTKLFQEFITGGESVPKSESLHANCQRRKAKGWAILNQRDPEFDGFRPTIKGHGKLACVVSPALKAQMLAAPNKKDDWSALIGEVVANPADQPVSEHPL